MEKKEYNVNVNLLAKSVPMDGSNNPEKVVASAIKFEYATLDNLNFYINLKNETASNIINMINRSGETDYLKHINFTFGIENISRECAKEILNYALAASFKDDYDYRDLFVTMNAEDLNDFFVDNCCSLAGEELNYVANQMLDICLYEAPTIFANAGAPCTFGKCDKKEESCNEKRPAKIKQLIKTY